MLNEKLETAGTACALLVTVLMAAAGAFAPAQAPTNQWTGGATNGQWSTPGNWSLGHAPTATEHAVIPPDSGTIIVPDGGANVMGLTLQDSADANPANNSTITGGPPGSVDTRINFGSEGVTIGVGCKIDSPDGAPGVTGGTVRLFGSGTITNDGEIESGSGGNAAPGAGARPGGSIVIRCGKLINDNVIQAGNGGSGVAGVGDGCANGQGREGGNVEIKTHPPDDESKLGPHCKAGAGGSGTPAGNDGWVNHNGRKILYSVGHQVQGSRIGIRATDPLDFQGAGAGSFIATRTIRIDAPGLTLTGIAPGTTVFDAAEVCLPANLLLDPGVSIQSLCGSATVHLGGTCGAGASFPVLEQDFEDGAGALPPGWTATTMMGPGGFNCLPSGSVPGPPDARFGCKSAVVNAAQGGGVPVLCHIESTLPDPRLPSLPVQLLGEFNCRYNRTSPGGSAQMSVVVNNVATVAWATNQTTPSFHFVQVNLDPFLPPIGTPWSLRWQFQGAGNDFLLLDNVVLRLPAPPLFGQQPLPGVALFDINDARNANNVPVFFAPPGPFFTNVPVNSTVNVHVEGSAFGSCLIGQSFVMPGTVFLPGLGQLDLDPLTLLLPVTLPLGPPGLLDLPVFIPPPLAGLTLGFQAALVTPAGPVTLSNAVEVHFGP